jgi:hypothetical protein
MPSPNYKDAAPDGAEIRLPLVKLRGVPFRRGEFPALDEYGVTLAQATAAEDSALAEIRAARKAGALRKAGKRPLK